MEHEIRFPEALLRKGFSSDTHAFRYRSDSEKSRKYSLEEISGSTIWHSAISALNDPFEVYARCNERELFEMSDEELFILWVRGLSKCQLPYKQNIPLSMAYLKKCYEKNKPEVIRCMFSLKSQDENFSNFINEIREFSAVASFTKVCDSRLMWGYYCNGLQGICIIYNKSKLSNSRIKLHEINYLSEIFKINIWDFKFNYRLPKYDEILERIPKCKHKEWIHEKEFRSILSLDGDEVGKGRQFKLNVNCIDGIIIGNRVCYDTKETIIKLSEKNEFKIFSAGANLNGFCIEIKDLT